MSHLDYDPELIMLMKENAHLLEEVFRLTQELEELKREKAKAAKAGSTSPEATQVEEGL